MKTRNAADIVFVIDASDSMQPCIDGLKRHIGEFVNIFRNDANSTWDIRLEFIAHSVLEAEGGGDAFGSVSVHEQEAWNGIYGGDRSGNFFTTAIDDFRESLSSIKVTGDEAMLLALDYALDLPWRNQQGCRKIVLLFTDEPLETGALKDESKELLKDFIQKIHDLKAYLYLVTPDSQGYEQLSSAHLAQWEVIDEGNGMSRVDLKKILEMLAKSITASQAPLGSSPRIKRALFGQDQWGTTAASNRQDRV